MGCEARGNKFIITESSSVSNEFKEGAVVWDKGAGVCMG